MHSLKEQNAVSTRDPRRHTVSLASKWQLEWLLILIYPRYSRVHILKNFYCDYCIQHCSKKENQTEKEGILAESSDLGLRDRAAVRDSFWPQKSLFYPVRQSIVKVIFAEGTVLFFCWAPTARMVASPVTRIRKKLALFTSQASQSVCLFHYQQRYLCIKYASFKEYIILR